MQTLNHKYFLLKRKKQSQKTQSVAWFMAYLLATFHVQADNLTLPTDPVIAAGDINITSALGQMQINQASQSGIINWKSFSIGRDASVNFQQPSANAITLNRVTGGSPSSIFGQMSANGNIFLVNPSGILFGRGSMVDVGLIVASVSDITDQNFLSGHYEFTRNSDQSITNQGSIKGEAVALIGPDVRNEGTIVATLGDVALVSGRKVTVALDSNRKLSIAVDESSLAAFIENSGDMKAESGTVILKARSSQDLVDQTINMPQSANAFVTENGVVRLVSTTGQIKAKTVVVDAGPGGASFINGTIDVSSLQDVGGQITLTGKEVTLGSLSRLKAQGLNGGGKILVGGDWQGSHGVFQSTYNTIHQGAVLDASASGFGNGGTIVAWSDITHPLSITRAYGNFKADAGILGGNGGMIETSGHRLLTDDIMVSAASSFGNGGEWLLDPYDVTISTASNSGTSFTSGTDFTALATSIINVSNINSALNSGTSVSISTGSQSEGTITVSGSILKSAGGAATLTLTGANIILGSSTGYSITASGTGVALSVTLNVSPTGVNPTLNSYADMNLNGGTFTVINNIYSDYKYRGKISGDTALVISGNLGRLGGWFWLYNSLNDFTGGIAITNGYVVGRLDGSLGLGPISINAGTLDLWVDSTIRSVGAVTIGDLGGSIEGSYILTGSSYTINNTSAATISAKLAGTNVALTKSGSGTLTLSGANTYTGATTISAGTLKLGASDRIADASALVVTGTFDLNGFSETVGSISGAGTITSSASGTLTLTAGGLNTSTTFSGVIQNGSATSVALTKSGSGTLTLSGANTYTGATTISAGTLAYGISNALSSGAVTVNGTTAILSLGTYSDTVGAVTIGSSGGSITSSSGILTGTSYAISNIDSNAATISAILAGSVALTKSGSGTLTLSGANTYTGTTTISVGGTLKLGNVAALSSSSGRVTVSSGAAFDLAGFTLTSAPLLTLNGTGILSGGALMNSGAAATYSGLMTLGSASSIVGGTGLITISNVGTITGATFGLTLGGTQGGTLTSILGTTTGTLTKVGSGTWTLSGANTYTGATTISAGTLAYGISNALSSGAVTVNGTTAILSLGTYNDTVGAVTIGDSGGSITSSSGILTGSSYQIENTSSNTASISAILAGSGALTKSGAGTLTLSGANTYTGLTTISAGTLKLGATGDSTNTPLGTVALGTVVSSGATLDLAGYTLGTAEALTLNGTGIDSGGALKNSSNLSSTIEGNIILGSSSTVVSNGNLTFNGTIQSQSGSQSDGSLTITASNKTVTLNGLVGEDPTTYKTTSGHNPYALSVTAGTINLNNDITTNQNQTFTGATVLGNNNVGGRSTTRTLLSLNPNITFNGSVDGAVANTYSLDGRAISTSASQSPQINFMGSVGASRPLNNITMIAMYDLTPVIAYGTLPGIIDTSPKYEGIITSSGSFTSQGDQTYAGQTFTFSEDHISSEGDMNFYGYANNTNDVNSMNLTGIQKLRANNYNGLTDTQKNTYTYVTAPPNNEAAAQAATAAAAAAVAAQAASQAAASFSNPSANLTLNVPTSTPSSPSQSSGNVSVGGITSTGSSSSSGSTSSTGSSASSGSSSSSGSSASSEEGSSGSSSSSESSSPGSPEAKKAETKLQRIIKFGFFCS